ncbi:pre-mRNA splicing factor [Vairimorpha necatrix]|uniref:Pre-mRNA splicing factor n=1 Tax=Vairimorpha necatrix TaxID=6039 RepID=A0AAX4JA69_9MICR
MPEKYKKRKTLEQRNWEKRKLKMAGIECASSHSENGNVLEVQVKDESRFRNINNVTEVIFDFDNPLFLIGNRPSKYYEKYKNNEFVNYNEIKHDQTEQNYENNHPIKTELEEDYKSLPVYEHKEDFLNFFESQNIILVTGDTGCGKSTLVPKFIFDKYKFRICVTQPRRISVKNLYNRMKKFYKSEVGYAIQYEQNYNQDTKIKYVTEGILLREITSDPLLLNYDVIICDEVHERSVNLDIILGYLKIIKEKRKDLKIILMSATLQIADFKCFFEASSYNFSGNLFPVDIKYLKIDVDDYIEWTTKKILTIHKKEDQGDILVFLSGKEDILQIYKILKKDTEDLEIIQLYSEIMKDVYNVIFNQKSKFRRCILSTNIAETSITIRNIKYVVDSGFHKIGFYDYNSGDRLIKYPISKENAIQRAGRAGRTGPGICYRMYSEKSYNEFMKEKNIPEILKSNISNTILLLLSTNYKKIENFPFLSKPPKSLINAGIITLQSLKFIDNGYNLTRDGKDVMNLGVDVILGKLIIEGIRNDCSYDSTLLASILSLDTHNIFGYFEKEKIDYKSCFVKDNEFITLLNLFKFGYKNKNFAPQIINRVRDIHENILRRIYRLGYKKTYKNNINLVILKTFFFNICRYEEDKCINLCTKVEYSIFNLDFKNDYLIFYKSFKNKRGEFVMQISASLKPEDILRNLPEYFKDRNVKEESQEKKNIIIFDNLYERFELESDNEL